MLNFGVLLFFVGALTGTLAAESYSYTSGAGAAGVADASYGNSGYGAQQGYSTYGQHQPGYSTYGTYGQGTNGYGYGTSGYSSSCGYTKVTQVLDSIFCEHGLRKRYSSTIYPAIEAVSNQLDYLLEFCFLQTVFDYMESAKQALETLQDAVYSNYEDSSLLYGYEEEYEETSEGTSGTSENKTSASSGSYSANKLAAARAKLKVHETNAKVFKTARGLKLKKKAKASSSNVKVKQTTKQRANDDALLDLTLISVAKSSRATQERDEALIKKLQRTMAKLKREAGTTSRKPRGTEYTYNSCAYLPATYCDTDKYDELLYNILDTLWTALDFMDLAACEISQFIKQISCETEEDRLALEEAVFLYGGIVTNFYTLLEVAAKVEKMYELVELDYGYDSSGYYRAGAGSSQPQPQMVAVQMVRRPMAMAVPMPINKTPASQRYPFAQYMTQSQAQPQTSVTYSSYSVPQQQQQQQQPYRVGRAPQQIPLAGHKMRPPSGHAPAIFLVG